MLRFVGLASVFLLFSLIGCRDSTGPVSLALNRARWEQRNLHDYAYTGRRICFCWNSGQDVAVIVLADTVFSARVVGTTVEEPKGVWHTVDELFELAGSRADHVERLTVEYHPELGYPTVIEVVCSRDLADCGHRIETRNLEPLGLMMLGIAKEGR
jgi:uncharacterized protein DUF6174